MQDSRDYWDQRYLNDDTPWDEGAPSPPLREFLAKRAVSGKVLVPGCGMGHDVRALTSQGADVVGLDISPEAIYRARMETRAEGEQYVCGDLFCLPQVMERTFDLVFEHTCFCAIDPELRTSYVKAVREALKPSGQLLAVFFMNPAAETGPPFGATLEELDRLFGKHFDLEEDYIPEQSYPGREARERVRLYRLRGI
ncbi:MAG: methyltransferase domain-containing protein [Verrucomicrobiota bacterium]